MTTKLLVLLLPLLLTFLWPAFKPAAAPPTTSTPTPTPPFLNNLRVLDLSGPGQVKDLVVRDQYAYIAAGSAGLRVVDLSQSSNPLQIGLLDTAGYTLDLELAGDYAYLADELGGLRIVDISTPSHPRERGFYDPVRPAEYVTVAGSYAYLLGGGEMRVIDVGNPTQPVEVGLFQAPGWLGPVLVDGRYAYVVNKEQAILIVDMFDPAQLRLTGSYPFTDTLRQMKVAPPYLYLVTNSGKLRVIDVSKPQAPVEVIDGETKPYACTSSINGVVLLDQTVYAATCPGLLQLDLSQPPGIKVAQSYQLDQIIFNLQQDDDAIYGYISEGSRLQLLLLPDLRQALKKLALSPPPTFTPSPSPTATPSPTAPVWPTAPPASPHRAALPDYSHNLELIGHIGGEVEATAVEAPYLYVGFGPELAIMDVSRPTVPRRLGYVVLPEMIEHIHIAGHYAYVSDSQENLWIIDVTDPLAPVQVGSLQNSADLYGSSNISQITTYGNYLYLATQFRGLIIVDITDPTQPAEIAQLQTSDWWDIDSVVGVGHYAYVMAAYGGLGIVDLADPARPQSVVFITKEELGPKGPSIRGHLALIEGYLVLGRQENTLILDITNPLKPVEAQGITLPPGWDRPMIAGYAYQPSRESEELQIFKLSDTGLFEEVGTYPSWSVTDNMILLPSRPITSVYLAIQNSYTALVDVSIPSAPVLQTTWPQSITSQSGWVNQDRYLYQAAGPQGLQIIDLHATPPLTYTTFNSTPATDVARQGPYLYVTLGQAGLSIYDLTRPNTPTLITNYQINGLWASQITVVGDHVYLSGYMTNPLEAPTVGRYQLRLINISQPTEPVEIARYEIPYWIWDVVVAEPYAYVLDDRSVLRVLDISEPSQPAEVGQIYLPNQAYKIALDDPISPQYAAVASGVDGLRVIDVSNPAELAEIAFYDTAREVWDVAVANDAIYLTDSFSGLYIFRLAAALTSSLPAISSPVSQLPQISRLSPYELVNLPRGDPDKLAYLIEWGVLSPEGVGLFSDYAFIKLAAIPHQSTVTGPDILLEITPGGHGEVHYLLYQATPDNKWVGWGHIRFFSAYGDTSYRLVTHHEGTWLVITRFTAGGGSSGAHLFEEMWYWLGSPHPVSALTVPVIASISPRYTAYSKEVISTVLTPTQLLTQVLVAAKVEGIYGTLYDEVGTLPDEAPSSLFSTKGQISYAWQPELKQFSYVPEQSTLSPHQLASMGSLDDMFADGEPDFMLKDNFAALLEMWTFGDLRARCWLVSYLEVELPKCGERPYFPNGSLGPIPRPEKRILLTMMKD